MLCVPDPHRSHREIGHYVEQADVLVTTSPWWDYIHIWAEAARHFGRPWVYSPEGWDNVHPVVDEPGHAKSQGWPLIPDVTCAHGEAMARVLRRRFDLSDTQLVVTGMVRVAVYEHHLQRMIDRPPDYAFLVTEKPTIVVCTTATMWNAYPYIVPLLEAGFRVIIRPHFVDPPELFQDLVETYGLDCEVIRAEGINPDSPERDHDYNPSVEDLIAYGTHLLYADAVVNVAGTPSLEALALGTPVINVNWLPDTATEAERKKMAEHYHPASHYWDVHPGGTSYLSQSSEEYLPTVKDALTTWYTDHFTRRTTVAAMLKDIWDVELVQSIAPDPITQQEHAPWNRPYTWGTPTNHATERIMEVIEDVGHSA